MLRVEALLGRTLLESDAEPGAPPVVVIGRSFAEQVLGDRNVVGQRLRYPVRQGEEAERWYEIVGVVDDPPIVAFGAGTYVALDARRDMAADTPRRSFRCHCARRSVRDGAAALTGRHLRTDVVRGRATRARDRDPGGARPRRILLSIFSRAFLQIGLGVLAGTLLGSLAIADEANGARVVGAVAVLMLTVGLLACAVPAIRALRIEPADALREA